MKRIIKLTEEQLRNIVSKVIKEQAAPIGDPNQITPQKSLNIGCVLKSMEQKKQITGKNGETFVFYNNGRFADVKGNKGSYECGAQASIVNLMFDSNPKAVKYFNMTPQVVTQKMKFVPNEVVPLKFGQSGNNIKMIQASLGVKPTGQFYTLTDAAVKKVAPEYVRQTGVTQQIFDKIMGITASRTPESTISMKDMQNMNNPDTTLSNKILGKNQFNS